MLCSAAISHAGYPWKPAKFNQRPQASSGWVQAARVRILVLRGCTADRTCCSGGSLPVVPGKQLDTFEWKVCLFAATQPLRLTLVLSAG